MVNNGQDPRKVETILTEVYPEIIHNNKEIGK
jgi:hypothetical protein